MLTLVLGGARSGKSRFAQSLCSGAERVVYIATMRAEDDELRARIAHHQRNRPQHWRVVEEPLELAAAIESAVAESDAALVDCLTLWLSNQCLLHGCERFEALQSAASAQLQRIRDAARTAHVVLVTNEVGCGVVPETELGRMFRDLQGWLNQDAARLADEVHLVVAGIPLAIKKAEAR
jgi:adenosylcobinamide kinase/adenosylcobinamide-phosphate guanylyltransferase